MESSNNPQFLTYGQMFVGINFNPSNDDKVAKAKQLCADLTDLLIYNVGDVKELSRMKERMLQHALGEILNAQMNVVKVLTFNY